MKAQNIRPGRPRQDPATDRQAAIITAACTLFAMHGIKGTSNQMLAEHAGVTPAMVNYYFKSRTELAQAVLDTGFGPVRPALEQARNLEDWVETFHTNLLRNPWIPHLVIREVIPENGSLQNYFLQHFARAAFATISKQIQTLASKMAVGPAFDLQRQVLLLMGMLIYPFIGRGVAEKVTGRPFDDAMMLAFRDEALQMFHAGMRQYAEAESK